jgi:hypothetical protein
MQIFWNKPKATKNRPRFGEEAAFPRPAFTCPHWLIGRKDLRPNKSEESAVARLNERQIASPAQH